MHRHQPCRRSARSRSRLTRLNNTPGSCSCQKPARQTAATQNPSRQTAPPKTPPLTHPSKPPVETGGSATEPGSRAGQLNPACTGPRPCCQQPTHAGSPAPTLPPVRSLPLAACQVEQHPRKLLLPKTIPADSRHPQSLPAASPTKNLLGPTPASPRWKPGDQPPNRGRVPANSTRPTLVHAHAVRSQLTPVHRHQRCRLSARSRSRLARLNNTPGSCSCQKPHWQTAPPKTLPGPTPASPRWKPGDQPQHKVPFPTRTAVASMAARFTMVVSRETGKPARLRKPGRFHVKRHHHAATDDKNNDSCRYTDSTLHAWWFHY